MRRWEETIVQIDDWRASQKRHRYRICVLLSRRDSAVWIFERQHIRIVCNDHALFLQ